MMLRCMGVDDGHLQYFRAWNHQCSHRDKGRPDPVSTDRELIREKLQRGPRKPQKSTVLWPQQPAPMSQSAMQVLRAERTHSSPSTELGYQRLSRNVGPLLLWPQKWLLCPGVYRSGAVC